MEEEEAKNKGGRPTVMGEPTRRIGPFAVGQSLYEWILSESKVRGITQGSLFRDALLRHRRSVRERDRRLARVKGSNEPPEAA